MKVPSIDHRYYHLGLIFESFAQQNPNRTTPVLPLNWKLSKLGRYPTIRSMVGTIKKKKKLEALQDQKEEGAMAQQSRRSAWLTFGIPPSLANYMQGPQ
jgi:hypothetical protein